MKKLFNYEFGGWPATGIIYVLLFIIAAVLSNIVQIKNQHWYEQAFFLIGIILLVDLMVKMAGETAYKKMVKNNLDVLDRQVGVMKEIEHNLSVIDYKLGGTNEENLIGIGLYKPTIDSGVVTEKCKISGDRIGSDACKRCEHLIQLTFIKDKEDKTLVPYIQCDRIKREETRQWTLEI